MRVWVLPGSLMTAAAAMAEPAVPADIIVTGERVDRSIMATASSVAVVDADALAQRLDTDVDQLLAMVPNVQIGSGGEGPAIRGQDSTGVLRDLSAFLGGTRPRTTISIDGRALGYYEAIFGVTSTWDIARVELFRGPQTTTNGRNSIAGAIMLTTTPPANRWEGRVQGMIGGRDLRQGSFSLSGPLIDGQIAFRAAADIRRNEAGSHMADGIVGADPNDQNHALVRLRLRVEPSALPGLRLDTIYTRNHSRRAQFDAIAPPFAARTMPTPERTNGVYHIDADSLTAILQVSPSPYWRWTTTLSWGDADIERFGLPGLGAARTSADDFSVESRLNWQVSPAAELLAGVSGLTTRQRQEIDISGLGQGFGHFDDHQRSVGLFAEATWRPLPRLSLTAGLRFQHDSQQRQGQVGPPGRVLPLAYDGRFHAWLPRVSVAYEVTDALSAGLTVQRGYNPGGVTLNLFRAQADPFDAEYLWNVEAFVRARFDEGRGLLTANAFRSWHRFSQRVAFSLFQPPMGAPIQVADMVNQPRARSAGAELAVQWQPREPLALAVSAGLLDTGITEASGPADPMQGKEFERAPALTASAAISWRPTPAITLSAQARTGSGYFSDDVNTPARRIPGYTVVNLRAAASWRGVTGFVYARNLFNRFYLTYLFSERLGTAGSPRELGVGLSARF